MNRRWLLVPAALMAAWIVYGTARWIADGASIARSWQAATTDWMTAVFLSDGMAFAAVASIAVLVDLRRRGARAGAFVGWSVGLLLLGTAALLTYIALRPADERATRLR